MAADVITVMNRTGTVVPLARGVILQPAGRHVYQQNDLTNLPYIAEHLSRAVRAGLVVAVTTEGETLTPARVLALGRAIHAHTHDLDVGEDPLTDVIARALNDMIFEISGAVVYVGDGEPVRRF